MRYSTEIRLSLGLFVLCLPVCTGIAWAGSDGAERVVFPDSVQVVEAVQGNLGLEALQPPEKAESRFDEIPAPLSPVPPGELRRLKEEARRGAPSEGGVQQLDLSTSSLTGPTVLRTQNGMNQSTLPNNAIPPDTILARSSNRVVEAVNRGVQLRTLSGSQLAIRDLNAFFGAATGDGLLFDPKVYYDHIGANERFYVAALQLRTSPRLSRIWLAVSRSPNPGDLNSGSWCRYSFEGRRNIGTTAESWADYPGLGGGRDALLISTNQFTFSSFAFTYSIVHVIEKEPLANNSFTCPALTLRSFQPATSQGDFNTFTLQPVHHYVAPRSRAETVNPAYLVNTFFFGGSRIYRLWQLRNLSTGNPTLARYDSSVSGQTYHLAPDSPQNGSTNPRVDTGDLRIYSASATSLDEIWAAHTVRCNMGGGDNESCVRIFSIFLGGFPFAAGPGYFITFGGGDGDFYSYPAVAVNGASQVAVSFQFAGENDFLGTAWAYRPTNSTSISATGVYGTGNCQLPNSPRGVSRAGDYSGAQTTPDTLSTFWLAGELARQTGSSCHWNTRMIELSP